MKKLLHIIATPRGEESRTLCVSGAFLEAFKAAHADWAVDELDLFKEKLPPLTATIADGKYALLGGKELSGGLKKAWGDIVLCIERFLSAEAYLLSTPMWNFSIPYALKHYIDLIVQPGYLFRYTAQGPQGLVKNKKMTVITSRGGDYTLAGAKHLDFQEPYLRTIFGFSGLTDIAFIHAQPMDMGPEAQRTKIKEAQEAARKKAAQF